MNLAGSFFRCPKKGKELQFKCPGGTCILLRFRLDGDKDCNMDEGYADESKFLRRGFQIKTINHIFIC
jgi:hypothetical protein